VHKERREVNDCVIGTPRPYLERAERLLVTLCHQFANTDVVSQSKRRVLLVVLRERWMGMSGSRKVGNNEARTSLLTWTPLVMSASVGFC